MDKDAFYGKIKKFDNVWMWLHWALGSWPRAAEYLDVNQTTLWRTATNGYEPKDRNIRKKLGIRGKPRHYVVSLGYIPEGKRDPYRQLTPDQRRQAMDNFIKDMED